MSRLSFVDTTLRDGHSSLWAMGMRTGMMAPIAEQIDEVGYKAIEIFGSGQFKKLTRELRENSWERLRIMSQRIRKTPLAFMMLPSITVFEIPSMPLLEIYVERLAANGIRRIQLMESSNDFSNRIPELVLLAKRLGVQIVLGLVYSLSPKHTDEYYAQKTRQAVALKPDAIYIKDPAGLLTIERTRSIVPAVLKNADHTPVEFHSHCTTGLAPAFYMEAIKQGIDTVHTGIPPLANGSAQPSVFNVARNASLIGYDADIDLDRVRPISEHFYEIARRQHLPIGAPVEYDLAQYEHHVPGGVISHLRHQLTQMKIAHRLDEVLVEVGRVRAELGYPIMVTPFSQFVCTQATLNVVAGNRYSHVPDEVIQLVMGHWGEEAARDVDANVRDRILAAPRAQHFKSWTPPQTTVAEARQRLGGPDLSDDELVLRLISPLSDVEAMHAAGPARMYRSGPRPITDVVSELLNRGKVRRVSLRSGNRVLSVHATRGA
jgi:oxaloacetate decarboxylase alpha subunit